MESVLKLETILRWVLLIEAIFYSLLFIGLEKCGVGYLSIALTILVIALAWRLSHALGSFVFTSVLRWRDNRTLPWGSNLAALATEFEARLACFNWSQAFPGAAMAPDPIGAKGGTPILLVHGYLCNRGVWVSFSRRLAAAGLGPIYTITLAPLFGSVDSMVGKLDARIEAICRETGAARVAIVAHSMGGLVTRAYRLQSGTKAGAQDRIETLVTLGTPHHGTRLARWGVGANVRQMRAGSEWLASLEAREAARAPGDVPPRTLSIYTLNDDLVYPPESSVLDWAENVPVSAVGHMALVFSKPVAQRVIQHLKAG